jgi:hypothetical protein
VQADQAEGQQGFSPEQREAIVEALSTLEAEQKAIERARARQQRQAQQGQAQQGVRQQAAADQGQAGASQSDGGLSGLLSPAQEAALASGLAKLRRAEQVQAQGGDAQAALDMSTQERQALLAVIQLIEELQQDLGQGQGVEALSDAQTQALVAAVDRLQAAQVARASGQASASSVAQGQNAATAAAAQATTSAATPNGPLSGGLYGLTDDKREVNADLAVADHKANGFSFSRNKAIWTTILRSSGQLESGLNFRSGAIKSQNWEVEYGVNVVGALNNIAQQLAPLDRYKIAPDVTVVRRLTDRLKLKVQGQAEFVPNAGAMLASAGLVYTQGIYEAAGNVSAKYEYLSNPSLPSSDPLSAVDATTLGMDLGVAASGFVAGATTTDASAKLVLSQVLDRDPTVSFTSKVVSKLTSDMSLCDRIAKARADYIETNGQALAASQVGPRRRSSALGPLDDIFAPEGQAVEGLQSPADARGPSFDDIFAPEGSGTSSAAEQSPSMVSLGALVPIDPSALPYDLRETTGRNLISQLSRLGYSDQKTLEASLDRGPMA